MEYELLGILVGRHAFRQDFIVTGLLAAAMGARRHHVALAVLLMYMRGVGAAKPAAPRVQTAGPTETIIILVLFIAMIAIFAVGACLGAKVTELFADRSSRKPLTRDMSSQTDVERPPDLPPPAPWDDTGPRTPPPPLPPQSRLPRGVWLCPTGEVWHMRRDCFSLRAARHVEHRRACHTCAG